MRGVHCIPKHLTHLFVSGVASHEGEVWTNVLNSVGVFIMSDVADRLRGASEGERQRSTSVLLGFLLTISA